MRYLLLLVLVLAPLAGAVDYEFVGGSADKFVIVRMLSSTDGSAETGLAFGDMSASYVRNNASADVHSTVLTMTMGTHVEWGWAEVDSTNSPGEYQFGIPDAAIADGADAVDLVFRATGAIPARVVCHLIDVDFRDGAQVAANVLEVNGSAASTVTEVDADLVKIGGVSQDALDLGDLASDGYNPSTNALLLVETATTVTNQVTAAQNRAEMDSNSTQLALILGDTAELQSNNIPTLIAALPTAAENRTEMDSNSTQLAAIVADTGELQVDDVPGLIAALPTTAEVNTQVDLALSDIHLDHLFAAAYDATSKPGEATALLNEMVEDDTGVTRYTENALEQAPSGTGGDATAANQVLILADTNRVDALIEDSTGDQFTTKALNQAPSGTGGDATLANQVLILADTSELQVDDVPGLIAALPTAVENRAEMDSNSTQLAAIVADTGELQVDDVPGLISSAHAATDADIATRAPSSTAMSNLVWTATKAGYLDVAASTRAPSATALTDVVWTDAKAGYVDVAITSRAAAATALSTANYTATRAGYLDNLTNLDAASSTLATAANQSANTTHLTDLKGATFNGTTDSNEALRNQGDTAWITAVLTGLSTFDATTDGVIVTTNNDKAGYALTSAYDPAKTAAQASTALSNATWTDARAAYLDNLDALVSTRAPSATALDKTVWTDAKAAFLDVLVSSRSAGATALDDTVWTDAKAAFLDVLVSSRAAASTALSTADYTSARATKLDNLDDLDTATSDLATDADMTTALAEIAELQGGTFDTATDSNEAIRNRGDAAWTDSLSEGDGDTAITSDTGGANTYQVLLPGGGAMEDAEVRAYLKVEYDALNFTNPKAFARTDAEGDWGPVYLQSGTAYTLEFDMGIYGVKTAEITP